MDIKVWTPLYDLEREMRSMFERTPDLFGETRLFAFRPIVDVVADDGTLKVTAELPGIDPDKDVEISVEGDMLVIKGEKSAEKEVSEKHRYLHERRFGSFERRLLLPEGVDPDSIVASYDQGILTVRVPVPSEASEAPHKIPIK